MKCDLCGGNHTTLECWNRNNLVPEAARPDGAYFDSSAWLGELEAALGYTDDAYKMVDMHKQHSLHCKIVAIGACLERAIKAGRRRSPSIVLSNPEFPK